VFTTLQPLDFLNQEVTEQLIMEKTGHRSLKGLEGMNSSPWKRQGIAVWKVDVLTEGP